MVINPPGAAAVIGLIGLVLRLYMYCTCVHLLREHRINGVPLNVCLFFCIHVQMCVQTACDVLFSCCSENSGGAAAPPGLAGEADPE